MPTETHRPTLPPVTRAILGPAASNAILRAEAPTLQVLDSLPFALLTAPGRKPFAFPVIHALARRVHADRAGAPIEVSNVVLALPGETRTRQVAGVWTTRDGLRERFLGYAWLGEVRSPREVLQRALAAIEPLRFARAA